MLNSLISFLLRKGIRGSLFLTNLFNRKYIHTSNKFGVKMVLDPREYLEKEIIANGYYEEEVINHLAEAKRIDNPVVWDIGANVGLHSLTFKKRFPKATVCCFEPFYYNFNKLAINEKLNPDIELMKFNFGLTTQLEVNKIYTSKGNAGRTSFLKLKNSQDTAVNILSCSGDFLVENNIAPMPNLIKIDVEGMELSVFDGCDKILRNPNLHTIIFEGPKNISPQDELIELLEGYGFQIDVIPRKIALHETNENYMASRKVNHSILEGNKNIEHDQFSR